MSLSFSQAHQLERPLNDTEISSLPSVLLATVSTTNTATAIDAAAFNTAVPRFSSIMGYRILIGSRASCLTRQAQKKKAGKLETVTQYNLAYILLYFPQSIGFVALNFVRALFLSFKSQVHCNQRL